MLEIRKTETYVQWIDNLRDLQARARIQVRIERLAAGNPGDVKAVGEGGSELRIAYGSGYRVYFTKRGRDYSAGLWRQDHSVGRHQSSLAPCTQSLGAHDDEKNHNYPLRCR